jgi:hypothetical protein
MFVEEIIPALNVPEEKPEDFDPTFTRDPNWLLPMTTAMAEIQWRMRAAMRSIKSIEHNNLRLSDGTSINYHDFRRQRAEG